MKQLLTAIIFLFLIFTSQAQNITNTLGSIGTYTIKDASTNYLTLSQSTGQVNILKTLRLENTTNSTTGVVFKGIDRFIHNYGNSNTFIGINSGNFTMTGSYNSALGYQSMTGNVDGGQNSAFGYQSLYSNTSGGVNASFGYQSMYSNTVGVQSAAFGNFSLRSNTIGYYNSAFGQSSLNSNTSGYENSAFGYYSLYSNTTGFYNSAFGDNSLLSSTTSIFNSAFGYNSLSSNTTGSRNSAFGSEAGTNITTGTNLTLVGYDTEPSSPTATNQVTLGNSSVLSLRCNVTTITSLSDARDKKNIHDLNHGLEFITKLKPRLYNWDKREWYDNNVSDGSKMQEAPTAGFIAQELDEVQTSENAEWLNLVLKDNSEKWEATPGNLLPVMVKAIQELNTKCDSLQNENKMLTGKLDEIVDLKKKLELLTSQIENLNIKTDELKKSSGNTNNKENNLQVISNENTK